jgi:hypothetical protein
MEIQNVTIGKDEYEMLKKKEIIADDALVQLKLSLGDIREGKVSKF